ncbi:MAG: hypothetical protein GF344_19990, partial [Chitinivibrionales bacterium]|nr:hypothetical protein [Chitinivibrionales bacterium]MBD3358895.1 hypothetical protein [Chitinivibrionales bacterium]
MSVTRLVSLNTIYGFVRKTPGRVRHMGHNLLPALLSIVCLITVESSDRSPSNYESRDRFDFAAVKGNGSVGPCLPTAGGDSKVEAVACQDAIKDSSDLVSRGRRVSSADEADTVARAAERADRERRDSSASYDKPTGNTPAYAVEIPSGVLFGEFAERDGPFLITGSVIVPAGQILKFGPGCKVYFGGDYPTLTVFGRIIVEGEVDNPIVFQSASGDPKPWDWDRIYIRSRKRAEFKHCVVRNANYGIVLENSAALIENCIFENNSLNGLVVENSEVVLRKCTFRKGHVSAVFCRAGAIVAAESLSVKGNITGIACGDKAHCNLTGGVISGNRTGLVVREGASVPIVGTDVTRNKIGVASEREIPGKSAEMVYGNGVDLKRVTPDAMAEILKPPEVVESIILPAGKTVIRTASDFEPGFSALKTPRRPTAGFIGNVTVGFSYFRPETMERLDSTDADGVPVDTTILQNYYIGEHTDRWYGGFQPELTIFAQGKNGNTDINLNMSLRANSWLDTPGKMRKEAFTLAVNRGNQSLLVGDFYENNSELSISGRELTGFRYTAETVEMGRGIKRFSFKLAGGESEVARDSGAHEYDRVEVVDSGFSVRQQLTYLASASIKPTLFSKIRVGAIVSRDQTDEPLFRKPIADPGSPDPVAAQMGVIDGNVLLLDGELELTGEIA